jgi:hypothetical protein
METARHPRLLAEVYADRRDWHQIAQLPGACRMLA